MNTNSGRTKMTIQTAKEFKGHIAKNVKNNNE